jgi:hypothetical protein
MACRLTGPARGPDSIGLPNNCRLCRALAAGAADLHMVQGNQLSVMRTPNLAVSLRVHGRRRKALPRLSAERHRAEAAIGQLTRLTSLHLSYHRHCTRLQRLALPEEMPPSMLPLTWQRHRLAGAPLQLQLLGCSRAARKAASSTSAQRCSGNGSSNPVADCNTSLQNMELECLGPLSDDELAGAAGALPD